MPKQVDYAGRFAFFEQAAFALVRDHGVARLSRHGVAMVLATSITTVRRLLNAEADLRSLALAEVGVRRRRRLRARTDHTGVDAALRLVVPLVPLAPEHVAEELVWWRLAVAAPSTALLPDAAGDAGDAEDSGDEDAEGPLHHRFAVASFGHVPGDVLRARVEPPVPAIDAEDRPDLVVRARAERDDDVAARVFQVLMTADPTLSVDAAARLAPVLHAVVDGLGVAVALGRLAPSGAEEVVRTHLEAVAGVAR